MLYVLQDGLELREAFHAAGEAEVRRRQMEPTLVGAPSIGKGTLHLVLHHIFLHNCEIHPLAGSYVTAVKSGGMSFWIGAVVIIASGIQTNVTCNACVLQHMIASWVFVFCLAQGLHGTEQALRKAERIRTRLPGSIGCGARKELWN